MTDAQWARSSRYSLTGRHCGVDGGGTTREVCDTIAFKFQTGTHRVRLPAKCDNWRGAVQQFRSGRVLLLDGEELRIYGVTGGWRPRCERQLLPTRLR
ncbi:hypothetical protein ACIQXA_14460 [Streptomyces massasporeus]|uniref:hypothetical protein n=1 Tax=Streptomyces massasporeus TaxID=67324 RepID=UPI0038060E4F